MSKSDLGKLICAALVVLAVVCKGYTMIQKNSVSSFLPGSSGK